MPISSAAVTDIKLIAAMELKTAQVLESSEIFQKE